MHLLSQDNLEKGMKMVRGGTAIVVHQHIAAQASCATNRENRKYVYLTKAATSQKVAYSH